MSLKKQLLIVDAGTLKTVQELSVVLDSAADQLICIARTDLLSNIEEEKILHVLEESDIIHAGLLFEGNSAFEDLRALTFNWHFLTPKVPGAVGSSSWKATADFICFDHRIYKKLNGFVEGLSLNASIMEFCFRALRMGASIRYESEFFNNRIHSFNKTITEADVLYFARVHLGKNYYRVLRIYYALSKFSFPKLPSKISPPPLNDAVTYSFKLSGDIRYRTIDLYTAIIPTIDRYDYIERSILSLLNNKLPPNEIIVVDQTSPDKRRPNIYQPFIDQGKIRVFYLNSPGQCSARNLAIEEAKNDWLLLFEDDTEAWPEMIHEHIRLLEYSLADVSTGVSLAPWKDVSYIPDRLKKYHISDVLATGNAFLNKETAKSVDGLDPAFDKGSGADDDFGKRLYLNGKLIVFNYKAIQTHHKAPQGGMRVHGSWWRNTSTLLGPYPPVTQAYSIRKYYSRKHQPFLFLSLIAKAKKRYSWPSYLLFMVLLPFKIYRSIRQTNKLQEKYPLYEDTNSK